MRSIKIFVEMERQQFRVESGILRRSRYALRTVWEDLATRHRIIQQV